MTAATDTSAASRPDPTADPADLVLHLGAAGADDARRSGAKAGRLAQLTRAGFAVPRGSPGRATGPVKVIRSVADVARLKPGDVLVTSVTTPAWTPAFSIVAAVVTDTGSVASHASVVAREYGVPAVVGTGNATTRLRYGDVVTVDGAKATVRLVQASS